MHSSKDLHYFGKLRRRREFIYSAHLARDECLKWELWFGKCSNSNFLLPFLDNKQDIRQIWLFVLVEEDKFSIGLTALSNDMSGRKYPFLMYTDVPITKLTAANNMMNYMAIRHNKFKEIMSVGCFDEEQQAYFEDTHATDTISKAVSSIIEDIAQDIARADDIIHPSSYWLNLHSSKYIYNEGAFTCSLYNKVYG